MAGYSLVAGEYPTMEFLNYLGAVFSAAFRLTLDTTQAVVFLAIVVVEMLAIIVPQRFEPSILAIGDRVSTRKAALAAFVAVVLTRAFLAPYWVWADEHERRLSAEAKIQGTGDRSPYHWPLLTPEETVALRAKIREIAPRAVSVSCAEDDCGDLARGFRDIFDDLHWRVMCCGHPFGGFDPGIHLWGSNPELRGLANGIEEATHGRLKVDMADRETWDAQKYPLQITIGSKPR